MCVFKKIVKMHENFRIYVQISGPNSMLGVCTSSDPVAIVNVDDSADKVTGTMSRLPQIVDCTHCCLLVRQTGTKQW